MHRVRPALRQVPADARKTPMHRVGCAAGPFTGPQSRLAGSRREAVLAWLNSQMREEPTETAKAPE